VLLSVGGYNVPTRHWTGNALQKFVKTHNQSLKHKVNRCVLSLRLNELLLINCSIQLGRPQRRLCRQILFLSMEQYSQCWMPSGDKSEPDHCGLHERLHGPYNCDRLRSFISTFQHSCSQHLHNYHHHQFCQLMNK